MGICSPHGSIANQNLLRRLSSVLFSCNSAFDLGKLAWALVIGIPYVEYAEREEMNVLQKQCRSSDPGCLQINCAPD
jgi:hypothetical protein